MRYKSIIVTERGSTEVMKVTEHELREPEEGEVRVKILATFVCQDDIEVRKGTRPFAAKPPFIPGYAIIGDVDVVGEGVDSVAPGERVAALVSFGGYAEYIYLDASWLVKVPASLDPAEAIPLILNYLVAYQIMHRVVKVKEGDKVLIVGASGGVGTAFLQLGKLAGLKMYGLASAKKHVLLEGYGAIPIDYKTQDFVDVLKKAEPAGIDYVFNGMGEDTIERGLAVLRRGGCFVHYGGPRSTARFFVFLAKFFWYNLLPNRKSIKGYGTHRGAVDSFKEDWQVLFKLLEEGKIKPVIDRILPIKEAIKANQIFESGDFTGHIVLVASDPW